MTRRERTLVLASTSAAVLFVTLLGYARLTTAKAAAIAAADRLAECSQLAGKISASRGAGDSAPAAREHEMDELISRIEAGGKLAGFPAENIDRIEPANDVPTDNVEAFVQVPTTVHLRDITLQQLFTFLYAVGAGEPALQVKRVRLSTPRIEDVGDRWRVETTLTYRMKAAE